MELSQFCGVSEKAVRGYINGFIDKDIISKIQKKLAKGSHKHI